MELYFYCIKTIFTTNVCDQIYKCLIIIFLLSHYVQNVAKQMALVAASTSD